jgi:hypothetical protein
MCIWWLIISFSLYILALLLSFWLHLILISYHLQVIVISASRYQECPNIFTLEVKARKFCKHILTYHWNSWNDFSCQQALQVYEAGAQIQVLHYTILHIEIYKGPCYIIRIRNYTNCKLVTVNVVWKLAYCGLFLLSPRSSIYIL